MSNHLLNPIVGRIAAAAASGMQSLATRRDNDLSADAVAGAKPAIAAEIAKAMTETPGVAVVETKSAWASKINWTQAVGLVATVLALWQIEMDIETQGAVVLGIQGVTAAVTWVMRSFFTKTVTKASVAQ